MFGVCRYECLARTKVVAFVSLLLALSNHESAVAAVTYFINKQPIRQTSYRAVVVLEYGIRVGKCLMGRS